MNLSHCWCSTLSPPLITVPAPFDSSAFDFKVRVWNTARSLVEVDTYRHHRHVEAVRAGKEVAAFQARVGADK